MAVPTLTRVAVGNTNLPTGGSRTYAGLIQESGIGTYVFDVFIPAGAVIRSIGVLAQALWTASESADLVVGDFNVSDSGGVGTALDADGFIASTSLIDDEDDELTVGQSISLLGAGQGGKAGEYNAGSNTHWNNLVSTVDRWLQFSIVAAGEPGDTGLTRVWAQVAYPLYRVVSQA